MRLLDRTHELLSSSDQSVEEIAKGADVTFYWLRRFKQGTILDPSVNRVQKVYEYLAGAPLLNLCTSKEHEALLDSGLQGAQCPYCGDIL